MKKKLLLALCLIGILSVSSVLTHSANVAFASSLSHLQSSATNCHTQGTKVTDASYSVVNAKDSNYLYGYLDVALYYCSTWNEVFTRVHWLPVNLVSIYVNLYIQDALHLNLGTSATHLITSGDPNDGSQDSPTLCASCVLWHIWDAEAYSTDPNMPGGGRVEAYSGHFYKNYPGQQAAQDSLLTRTIVGFSPE
jgi:hypothetical protein